VINIKTLLMAAGLSVGVAFALPTTSQAMPASTPVKMQTVKDSNIVQAHYNKRWKKWARYCRRNWDDPRCYRRHRHARYYRYRYYDPYYEPYYGYYEPYPYYGRRFYGPSIGFSFGF
jgi:hypothetical protein